MPSKPPDRFLKAQEVAAIIGLHYKTILNGECGTNELLRIRLGARVVFSENNVREWMANKAREAEEDQQREKLSVIDLMAERARRKQYVKDMAKQISDRERRRSSNYE